jgi:hypothetical protein
MSYTLCIMRYVLCVVCYALLVLAFELRKPETNNQQLTTINHKP